MAKGLLFVFSAPSGAGKDTILNLVVRDDPNIRISVSATTRSPRKGERDGVDYIFLNEADFTENIQKGMMLEYDCYCGHYYGTMKSAVEGPLAEGFDVFLEITVPGAMQIKEIYPESILIFIAPPDLKVLENRIRKRGTENEDVIQSRLLKAAEEMTFARHYDYIVVNDTLDKAVLETKEIIKTKRMERRSEEDHE